MLCFLQNNTYSQYFGAIAGRVSNRIANASFTLDGETYKLDANENGNQLHGGSRGWSTRIWNITEVDSPEGEAVELTYTSPDGEGVSYCPSVWHAYSASPMCSMQAAKRCTCQAMYMSQVR